MGGGGQRKTLAMKDQTEIRRRAWLISLEPKVRGMATWGQNSSSLCNAYGNYCEIDIDNEPVSSEAWTPLVLPSPSW